MDEQQAIPSQRPGLRLLKEALGREHIWQYASDIDKDDPAELKKVIAAYHKAALALLEELEREEQP